MPKTMYVFSLVWGFSVGLGFFCCQLFIFICLFVAEIPIMMEAVSLQGKTASIMAQFKNPYKRKICTLIRIKIYKSCQHTAESDLSHIPYA